MNYIDYPGFQMEPLCGWPWFKANKNKHTRSEIDSLSITVSIGRKDFLPIRSKKTQGKVAMLMNLAKER